MLTVIHAMFKTTFPGISHCQLEWNIKCALALRYGFWCIPKCSPYQNPDLENCVEIVDIPDPCCPRQECVRYRDPSNGPTTDPWGKGG